MTQTQTSSRIGGAISWILLSLTSAFLGAALGGLWVRLFVRQKQMGWDAIADALGGLMVGTLVGLVAGAVLAAFLSMRGRFVGSAVASIAAVGVFLALAATRPPRQFSQPVTPPKKAFAPPFSAAVRVSHTEEILRAVPPGREPIPFSEGKVWTVGPEVIRVGWGPDLTYCAATPSEKDLQAMVPVVRRAILEAGPICRTPREGDLTLSFALRLEEERVSASLEADCLAERPALGELVDAIANLAERLEPHFTCR
jgi:hypothetical protein